MAKIRGNGGIVKIGLVTVAAVKSFTIDQGMDPIESTDLSQDAKTFVAGDTSWTATVEVMWDAADVTGQGAMSIGTEVVFHGVRDGDAAAPADDVTGDALVQGISSSVAKGEMVSQTFNLQGTGVLAGV